jgi:hypothetical protein
LAEVSGILDGQQASHLIKFYLEARIQPNIVQQIVAVIERLRAAKPETEPLQPHLFSIIGKVWPSFPEEKELEGHSPSLIGERLTNDLPALEGLRR